ncbi:MAG TPA: hypothetical protein PL066_04065, partial [bacterium]|nr:hypothetical protein [bacterium]
PTPTPTPAPANYTFTYTVQPAWYCGSKRISEMTELCTGSIVYVNNQVTELRSGIDPLVIVAAQTANAPTITKLTYFANNKAIKTCNSQSCSLTYVLPNNDQTLIQIRADFSDGNYAVRDVGYYLLQNVSGGNSPTGMMERLYMFVKGSGPQVYLKNWNGERYYVPDWSVLKSWYTPDTFWGGYIHTFPDSTITLFPLKGNLIYKPGSLVKINTDPKCYTVDKEGKLRWVKNETIARALYGNTWNKNIYIIPDSLFVNYGFGQDIDNANNYSLPTLNEVINMYNN